MSARDWDPSTSVGAARVEAEVGATAAESAARDRLPALGDRTSPAAERARDSARRAYEHLASLQAPDGHFRGTIDGSTILESEYLLLMTFLGRLDEEPLRRAGEYIRRDQEPHGGWAIYPGGPADVSTSVKSYFALKLLGDAASAPHMARARKMILRLGGVEAANSFTKIQLAVFGQYPWSRCPAIPPEMVLLPGWFYFNLHEMSSWSRVILVPLSIIWASRPLCEIPLRARIDELHCRDRARPPVPASAAERLWQQLFRGIDRCLRGLERLPRKPLRRRALRAAERWMLRRMEFCDGLDGIFPAMVSSVIALRCLGYAADHPRVVAELDALDRLRVEEGDTLRLQPCSGPAWDTALSLGALVESRPAGDDVQRKAATWLLDREVLQLGDWAHKNRDGRPGGWAFQEVNGLYPDCDDTAQILIDLARIRLRSPGEQKRARTARARGLAWLVSMQNRDGGWAAFDKNCDKRVLTFIPFADHNAMIDPSCADITGRALEAMARSGMPQDHPAVRAGVRFLRRQQEADGSWYGRWGCNYIYGTSLALKGLAAAGEDMTAPRYRRSGEWLQSRQRSDGGWGESLASYRNPAHKGSGASTAAQTAWALLALFALGDTESASVRRGLAYLIETQREDGGWRDRPWTGTGFPGVFYLRYDLYDRYFPLLALGTYLSQRTRGIG